MFLDTAFSEIGRSTGKQLDGLRRQLGVGIDPAYDYTQMLEALKKAGGQKAEKKKDVNGRAVSAEPALQTMLPQASGLDQLRRALRDVTGACPDEPDREEPAVQQGGGGPSSPAHDRSRSRPSPAFQAPGRGHLAKLDVTAAWRAPPVGTYRPKEELCIPRLQCPDFSTKEPTRSRLSIELEQEVARLKAEKQPYEHLLKPAVSVELLDHVPDRPRQRPPCTEFDKLAPRPDIVKLAGIVYNNNTSTDGVLDADVRCSSQLHRSPQWDFAKLSVAEPKPQETYFQPGQYKVNLAAVRPRSEAKLIPFEKQPARKPLREVIGRVEIISRPGDHLPDRSLARSCPLLSTEPRIRVPDISKYTVRPAFFSKVPEYHNTADPNTDRIVMEHNLTFNIMEADKVLWRKPATVEHFDKALERQQQLKKMRSYGEDICLQRAKDYTTRGPVSVEYLSDVDNSPTLRPRVQARDFTQMAGRDPEKRFVESPSRKRDLGKAAKFERGVRQGDSRSEAQRLSPLAGSIGQLRSSRAFVELPTAEVRD